MRHLRLALGATLVSLSVGALVACTGAKTRRGLASVTSEPHDPNAYYTNHGDFLVKGDKEAALGRDIWVKATAGNARFFAYVFPQRVSGKSINWPDMLMAKQKKVRFKEYGLINDPDCCSPAVDGECEKKFGRRISVEETYGFDYCPGDETLLQFVGREGYRDPACDLKYDVKDKNRENSCNLEFGTSTGTVGLRKFPNPRFDRAAWSKAGGWAGYINMDSTANGMPAVDDHALEPPFRIGMACTHCHVSFLPTNPPANPAFPKWENLNTLVGNQYLMAGQVWGSGFAKGHVSSQSLAMSRPGTVDTSAVPNDISGNPGSQNAIINIPVRPADHPEKVLAWRKTKSCAGQSDEDVCWCEPQKPGKCWLKSTQPDKVPHVLKGGEDSVSYALAIQRVYFNIGSCSEQCWLNNLTDMLVLDPRQRNYDQRPFNIGQCRRDCPQFRAIEDRTAPIIRFFLSSRPTDMKDVKDYTGKPVFASDRDQLKTWLETKADNGLGGQGFGVGAVERGAAIYAGKCASCHSSAKGVGGTQGANITGTQTPVNHFLGEIDDPIFTGQKMRKDWLGNDRLTEVTAVGTNSCRSRHSNHMKGHVYEEFASLTYHGRAPVASRPRATNGRGYYRNISLLSAWAHAPFMHNNALGPELCGDSSNPKWSYGSYLDPKYRNQCRSFDPSFEGRFQLFVDSSREMLTPSTQRPKKAMLTTEPVVVELVPAFWRGHFEKGQNQSLTIQFGKGINSQRISSFRHKDFAADFMRYMAEARGTQFSSTLAQFTLSQEFTQNLKQRFGPTLATKIVDNFAATARHFLVSGISGDIVTLDPDRFNFYLDTYSNCVETADNLGHDFGTELTDQEKNDLIAFMALL